MGGKDIKYPILINDPISVVKKLLPLMKKGIVMMHKLSIVAVFAQIMAKTTFETPPNGWIGAAHLIDKILYMQQTKDFCSTRSVTSLSQNADAVREEFLHFLSRISENSASDQATEDNDLDWEEEVSILRNLIEKSNLSIANFQHNFQLDQIKANVGGGVWVQKKLKNTLQNKTKTNITNDIVTTTTTTCTETINKN